MHLQDLWIGDTLKIKSSNRIGTFHGIDGNGYAILKLENGELKHITSSDLEIYIEPERPIELKFDDEPQRKSKALLVIKSDNESIDLHYDSLIQYYHHERGHILDFQIEKCKDFLEQSIESKKSYVRIICGKGEGKLHQAVLTLLKKYDGFISLRSAHYEGASVDVWFK